ncbi:MAG: cation transporter [Lachnospiraceae bacterium]|nr:cation transporter [Lachnospiraceae bacterium]
MQNILVIAVLFVIVGIAVYGTVKRIRYGSSCCGTRDAAEKKVKVSDRNRANYPYTYVLAVDGMHCSNCARRIENAFNKTGGRWAVADVGKKEVTLLSKHEESEAELINITAQAGYTMLSFSRK